MHLAQAHRPFERRQRWRDDDHTFGELRDNGPSIGRRPMPPASQYGEHFPQGLERDVSTGTGPRLDDCARPLLFRTGIRVQRIDENVGIDRYRDFVSPRS